VRGETTAFRQLSFWAREAQCQRRTCGTFVGGGSGSVDRRAVSSSSAMPRDRACLLL